MLYPRLCCATSLPRPTRHAACAVQVSFEVRTPHAGTVAEFFAAEGDTVTVGAPLFRIEEGEAPQGATEAAPAAEEGANGGTVEAMEDLVVEVPNLGDSIVDGTLANVAAPTGSSVNTDDVVAVIDTDKVRRGPLHAPLHQRRPSLPRVCSYLCVSSRRQVSFDVRSPASGTILEFFAQEDDTVQVGAPLFKMSQVAGGGAQSKDAAAASDATAPADGATNGSAASASSSSSHGHRVPSIRFRHGKRDAEPSPSSAPSSAAASAPAGGVKSTRGSGTSAVTVEDVAFEDLPPMFGRPPMRDFEFELIESGGAEAWN